LLTHSARKPDSRAPRCSTSPYMVGSSQPNFVSDGSQF